MSSLSVYYRFKLDFISDEVRNTFQNEVDKTGFYLYVKPVNGAIWEPKGLNKLQSGEYQLKPLTFKQIGNDIVTSVDMVLTIPADTDPRDKKFSQKDFEHFFEVRGELWKSGVRWWNNPVSTEYFEPRASNGPFANLKVKTTDSPTRKSQGNTPNQRIQSLSAPQFVGVLFWVETKGTGHAWVSVHRANKENKVYSYGRFGATQGSSGESGPGSGSGNPFGEGIMLNLPGKKGITYNMKKFKDTDTTKAYHLKDVNVETVYKLFEAAWNTSSLKPNTGKEDTDQYGHVLDVYRLFSNNCTTLSGQILLNAGTKVFDRMEAAPRVGLVHRKDASWNPDDLAVLLRKQSAKKPEIVEDYTSRIKAEYDNR